MFKIQVDFICPKGNLSWTLRLPHTNTWNYNPVTELCIAKTSANITAFKELINDKLTITYVNKPTKY